MIRYVLAAAVATVGVTAALAQDPVAARRSVMKAVSQPLYGVLGQQAQGRAPFNQAQVDSAFNAVAAQVARMNTIFPPDSNKGPDAGSDYYAAPAAFQPQAKADIDAKVAAVARTVEDNKAKAKDQESLRAAFGAINNACNACHSTYRARKS